MIDLLGLTEDKVYIPFRGDVIVKPPEFPMWATPPVYIPFRGDVIVKFTGTTWTSPENFGLHPLSGRRDCKEFTSRKLTQIGFETP